MKEQVSRKVGLDITNTITNKDIQGKTDQPLVSLFKSKKSSKGFNKEEPNPCKQYYYSTTPHHQNQQNQRLQARRTICAYIYIYIYIYVYQKYLGPAAGRFH